MRMIVVILLIVAIGAVGWFLSLEKYRSSGGQIEVARDVIRIGISPAVERFKNDVGRYPTSAEGIGGLFSPSPELVGKWNGPYINGEIEMLVDPWGRPYIYSSPGVHNPDSFDLWSHGPDGVESSDDIGNW